jgi:hypothetical protein
MPDRNPTIVFRYVGTLLSASFDGIRKCSIYIIHCNHTMPKSCFDKLLVIIVFEQSREIILEDI